MYKSPFPFTGAIKTVTFDLDPRIPKKACESVVFLVEMGRIQTRDPLHRVQGVGLIFNLGRWNAAMQDQLP